MDIGIGSNGAGNINTAFLLDWNPTADRCYTTFQQLLSEYVDYSSGERTKKYYVSDLAKYLFQKLRDGHTIGKAYDDALAAGWKFRTSGGGLSGMVIGPEPFALARKTRLIGYYEAPEGSTQWIKIGFKITQ